MRNVGSDPASPPDPYEQNGSCTQVNVQTTSDSANPPANPDTTTTYGPGFSQGMPFGFFNPVGLANGLWGYQSTKPSTDAAGVNQQATLPATPTLPSPTVATATANIIQPTIANYVAAPFSATVAAATAASHGGFLYTDEQLNSGLATNAITSFFSPSSYGAAGQVTTPPVLSAIQTAGFIGIGVVTGGLAGEFVLGSIGTDAAATWSGTFLIGAVGGATGSFFQNAATQALGDQPFSATQLAEATVLGGIGGGVGGVLVKGIISGVSWGINAIVGDAATDAASGILNGTALIYAPQIGAVPFRIPVTRDAAKKLIVDHWATRGR